MLITPTEDHLLVLQAEEETEQNGIILATTGKKPNKGTVLEVGEQVLYVKKGDKIVFGKFKGEKINVDDKEYLILREKEIAGIVLDK